MRTSSSDKSGMALTIFISTRRSAANLLSRDEARRMAVHFAKPPELLKTAAVLDGGADG
jgi:hypothetical protein